MPQPIILIGPMGAGKSSIGRQLAGLLDLPFLDTDRVIQERSGVDIDFIFEKEGEAGFRRREEMVLADLVNDSAVVIATGGGVVLSAVNRECIKRSGTVVFLETSIEWQLERTQLGRHRPLLATADPKARLTEIYALREPLYRDCATVTVNTDGRRVSTVANAVMDALQNAGRLA